MSRQNSSPNNPGTVESAYRAPESNVSRAPANDLLMAFVGKKNAQYYQQRFQRFEAGGGAQTWHWPAFFFTSGWLLYRKMWWQAALYIFGLPLLSVGLTLLLALLLPLDVAELAINLGAVIFSMIFMPMYANRLYFDHANRKVASIAAAHADPTTQREVVTRKGGTSLWVLLPVFIFVLGILAAIAIPAYQDYTVRAQVIEGLNLSAGAKAAVTEFAYDRNALPRDNAEAGLSEPRDISGNYVESVAVREGLIVVTYGNAASDAIAGQRLTLRPYVENGSIADWDCFSDGIPAAQLPAACRR